MSKPESIWDWREKMERDLRLFTRTEQEAAMPTHTNVPHRTPGEWERRFRKWRRDSSRKV